MDYRDKLRAKLDKAADAKLQGEHMAAAGANADKIADAVNNLTLTTFLANQDGWSAIVQNMAELVEKTQNVVKGGTTTLDSTFAKGVAELAATVKQIGNIKVESDQDAVRAATKLAEAIEKLDVNPVVNVPTPQVTVNERAIDMSPILRRLEGIREALLVGESNEAQSGVLEALNAIERDLQVLIKKPNPAFSAPWQFRNTEQLGQPLDLVESTDNPDVLAVPIVNPDGSTISGGGGGASTPTTVRNGKATVTTAGTAVQIESSSVSVQAVVVQAAQDNTGTIYVGDSSVDSSNGYELAAGQAIGLAINNLNKVYVDSSADSQSVTYLGS